jgi:mannose-6-phosphate isomerase-like protein (cupin superfamily)
MNGIVRLPGEGEVVTAREGRSVVIKADFEQLSVLESYFATAQPGADPHIHRTHADSFYVIEGELAFRLGEESVRVPEGTLICAPPDVVHGFANESPEPVRYLNVHAPDAQFAESMRVRSRGEKYDPTRYDSFDPPEDGGRPATDATVSRSWEGEVLTGPERLLRVKVSRDQLDLLEFEVGPDYEGPGPHFHKRHVDSFYVLEGELEFTVDGETVRAPAGTYVAAPLGVVHSFTNPGPGRARFLNIHAPDLGFVDLQRARDRGEDPDPEQFDVWNVD